MTATATAVSALIVAATGLISAVTALVHSIRTRKAVNDAGGTDPKM